ncbi:hypothetical protein [Roseofilum capinflatum]|uniref:Resolvase n=1 Tax=Roseofilum capinflatum BLCC-M114 TaxID=3022440 RepID=A0ABT7B8P5_9CYAN|nr:hypothetical protein [Roseofilum capinflatum]MDJ1174876.1 hypothetical protein [Roseofilum capinflatum BLCC-M114]
MIKSKFCEYILGVDPGKAGALVILDLNGNFVDLQDFPVDATSEFASQPHSGKINTFLDPIRDKSIAFIEKVGAMPGDGRSTLWSFAENYGYWIGTLHANGIPCFGVRPQIWKSNYGLLKTDKKASIAKAKEIFPDHWQLLKRQKDHGRAEAMLIAYYGIRHSEPFIRAYDEVASRHSAQ